MGKRFKYKRTVLLFKKHTINFLLHTIIGILKQEEIRENIAHVVGCVLLSVWNMPSGQYVCSSRAEAQLWHFSELLPQRTQSSHFELKNRKFHFPVALPALMAGHLSLSEESFRTSVTRMKYSVQCSVCLCPCETSSCSALSKQEESENSIQLPVIRP